jgi:protein gp37
MACRLKAMGNPHYHNGFSLTLHPDTLSLPLNWKKPQSIFVNSMSDLFHEDVPDSFIFEIFEIMKKANWHQFQILTKRSNRLLRMDRVLEWPDNVWMGVTVENQENINRIDDLRKVHAKIKFLSLEPLLSSLSKIKLSSINWVIVGGESGPGARPIEEKWIIDIRDQCIRSDTPFFFKQWGGVRKKENGRTLEGQFWSELPQFQPST